MSVENPNVSPPQEPDQERRWKLLTGILRDNISQVAWQQAPLKSKLDTVGATEPNETYWSADSGNYRVLHAFTGQTSHVEIDYYPASPDIESVQTDPNADEPIIRLRAELVPSHADGQSEFSLLYERGAKASQPDEQVEVNEDTKDAEALKSINQFMRQVFADLPEEPDGTMPSARNIRGVVSDEHDLQYTDGFLFVDSEEDDRDLIRRRKVAAEAIEELEIGRAAARELCRIGVVLRTDSPGVEQAGIDVQYERMQTELAAMHERNTKNVEVAEWSPGAGRELIDQPATAEKIAQQARRSDFSTYEDVVGIEPRIPKEGLSEVPKDHIMLFVTATPLGMLGREKYKYRNTISAVASEGVRFRDRFFSWKKRGSHYAPEDPDAVDATFDKTDSGTITTRTGVEMRTRLRDKEELRGMDIERIMLIGPGDNVVMTARNKEGALEHLVSNIAGELYVDGKKVSGKRLKKLHKRLERLRNSEDMPLVES